MNKKLAIIVVNWNGLEDTETCISSLRSSTFQDFDIILVDNGSTTDVVEPLRKIEDIYLIESAENTGFTGGNNLGIRHALDRHYPFIMLLNNDTTVDPEMLELMMSEIGGDIGIGAVQPKIYFQHEPGRLWNAGGGFNRFTGQTRTVGEGAMDQGQFDLDRYVAWISGCCILLPTHVIREVGLLDDRFFAYFEDVDWSFRIRAEGYKLKYVHSAVMYHVAGASGKSKKKQKEGFIEPILHYYNFRNHVFVLRKHLKGIALIIPTIVMTFRALIFMVYFAIRLRPRKMKYTLQGLVDGYRNTL